MAFKTTIGPQGIVTELVGGTQDQLVVDVESARATVNTVVSGAGTVSLNGGTNLFISPVTVTASLPSLSTANEGTRVLILNDLNGDTFLVTSSNSINGVTTPVVMSSSYGVLDVVGVKSNNDGGFVWQIITSTDPV